MKERQQSIAQSLVGQHTHTHNPPVDNMLPINGAPPRHGRSGPPQDPSKNKWQGCYMVSLTLFASAILATLVTFGVLNFLLNGVTLPPVSSQQGLLQDTPQAPQLQQDGSSSSTGQQQEDSSLSSDIAGQLADELIQPPAARPPPAAFHHMFEDLQKLYTVPEVDSSPRCQSSQICDGDHSCGPDKLGCVTAASERKAHVRKAIAWAWEGYRCGCQQAVGAWFGSQLSRQHIMLQVHHGTHYAAVISQDS